MEISISRKRNFFLKLEKKKTKNTKLLNLLLRRETDPSTTEKHSPTNERLLHLEKMCPSVTLKKLALAFLSMWRKKTQKKKKKEERERECMSADGNDDEG